MNNKLNSVRVAIVGIVAALYITLGYLFQPISFLGLQFRVAEIMVGVVIIFPYSGMLGNIIGVFFVNIMSPLGALDLISVLVNIPALYCIVFLKSKAKYLGGILYSWIIAIYVAWLLKVVLGLPFEIMMIQVFVSELVIVTIGISIFNYVEEFI